VGSHNDQIYFLLPNHLFQLFPKVALAHDHLMAQAREGPILNKGILQPTGIAFNRIHGGPYHFWSGEGECGRGDYIGEVEFRAIMASDRQSVTEWLLGHFREIGCNENRLETKFD
jgi:hypothetical protein